MNAERIILVTRPTRLMESVKRFNTVAQARFFITKRGQSFDDYSAEDDNYSRARDLVMKSVPRDIKLQSIDREFLPNFIFTEKDLVITLGQDGLVVNVAKYLDGQSVIAVNPDPGRFDGVLLPFLPEQLPAAVEGFLSGRYRARDISMAEAGLNDGQRLLAFNDFFIGPRSHTSARYTVHYRGTSERQSSSGIIVSTPAGSTGWLSSLCNMADGLSRFTGGREGAGTGAIPWEERRLIFVVREPFRSRWSGADLVAGELVEGEELVVESHMPEEGVIFSDGMLADFMQFNSGATVAITLAARRTSLIVEAG